MIEQLALALALGLEQHARSTPAQQRQTLHHLFAHTPTLFVVLRGPKHEVTLANPPICLAWGHLQSALHDRALFEVVPGLGAQGFTALLDGVYETGVSRGGRGAPAAFLLVDHTVELRLFDFVCSAFRDLSGVIAGVFMVASDVTAQVLAQRQVEEQRKSGESAHRAKDELLAMLGHELRNPLSPVLTALQLMRGGDVEASGRAHAVVERQVKHLIRLVDDLLDVACIARGDVVLQREVVELAVLVKRAVDLVGSLFLERDHRLSIDVAPTGLTVNADPARITQVISNLLINAAKYTLSPGEIQVSAERSADHVLLTVRDPGIGMSSEVLPHVFELFVQERQASDRLAGGLGLGLSIVQNLIQRHGGTVSAVSVGLGLGSAFSVRLPWSSPVPTVPFVAPTIHPEAVLPSSRPTRVLVVDDNEDAASLLSEALERRGYTTRDAYDGPSALVVAAEFLPDIALLDIGLPLMDGYELAARVRELPGLREILLIALTGYGQESDRLRSHAAGFQVHLVKPITMESLTQAMSRV